jgi:hypothetical protein
VNRITTFKFKFKFNALLWVRVNRRRTSHSHIVLDKIAQRPGISADGDKLDYVLSDSTFLNLRVLVDRKIMIVLSNVALPSPSG